MRDGASLSLKKSELEMKSVVWYALAAATARCVASAAICFQPFLAAMSSVHVAKLAAIWTCPGLALSPKWFGCGRESGFIYEFESVSGNLCLQLKSRVFESSGFSGFATDLESLLFSLKGRVFESSGFSGMPSELRASCLSCRGTCWRQEGL